LIILEVSTTVLTILYLLRNYSAKIKKTGSSTVEIQNFVTLAALDIIVETAMGKPSDLQSTSEDNDYVNAIYSS